MSKPRAVAYVRVSKERIGMISPELQMTSIQGHCDRLGYDIVATLEDLDLSGRFWKRRQVEQAIKMIESKQADVLVVWKISRVSRNRMDWAIAVDRVESIGGRLESATEPMDTTTSSGRFSRGMLAELAVFESERIGDTWKETHARRIRNGLPHNAPKHFGYAYTKEAGYTPETHEGAVLRQLYIRFTAGVAFSELGAYAASEGFEPETGWRKGTIRRFLDKGFGAGYLWVKGEHIKGAHEPVISEAEWNAYRVRREERGSRPRAENSDYIYSGLLRCHCGGSMGGSFVKRGDKIYRRYVCLFADQKGTHTINTISETYVEKAVLTWLENVAAEWDAFSSTVKAEPIAGNVRAKLSQIKADLAKTVNRLDALTIKNLDGDVSNEVYNRLKDKLEADKAALEARQRLLEVNATVKPQTIVPQMLASWADTPARVKRETLRALGVSIHLHDWETESRSGGRTLEVRENWL
jgi:site-specific DNA recombinase